MSIFTNLKHRCIRTSGLVLLSGLAVFQAAFAQRVILPSPEASAPVRLLDLGVIPGSQMLSFTVHLRPTAQHEAALEQAIVDQQRPESATYRQWMTVTKFAQGFGAADEQIATVSNWLESQGLTVGTVSAGRTRLTVTGSAARAQAAFGVELRRYSFGGVGYVASTTGVSLPAEMVQLVSGVSGLDDRFSADLRVYAMGPGSVVSPLPQGVDALSAIESFVDANAASILTVDSAICNAQFGQGDHDAWLAVLRQAEAQGITVLAGSRCNADSGGMASFPASSAEVTAVAAFRPETATPILHVSGEPDERGAYFETQPEISDSEMRPTWQFAEGLPVDGLREEPDLTADVLALAKALAGVAQQAGTRLGNVAPVLYELAKTPGLYSQPDGAGAGTWEPATGLGAVDLKLLAQVFPRGAIGTSSLLVASNYAPYHGKSLTLTATVTSTGGSGIPTGTVTFTSTQKGTLGTATLNAQGVGTFTSDSLPGGTYTLTSVYSGDATYTASTSGVATVTVVGELSIITATVASGAAVGGNATVNVSVTSASGVGTPSGTVTVAPQGTTNPGTATATLTGTNGTATAAVLLPVYQAGTFTLLVSCSDPDPSFTCYSPISAQMTVAKGPSTTTITSSPTTPSAGQPYTLAAAVMAGVSTASAIAPTGSVQFADAAIVLGVAEVKSGAATYSGTATSGTHNFVASYSGDQNYLASSSADAASPGGAAATSATLTISPAAPVAGATTTLTATIASLVASAVNTNSPFTGTVQFMVNDQAVGTVTVSGSSATLATVLPSGMADKIVAIYSGDANWLTSTSNAVTVSVASVATATTLSSNVTQAISGEQVLLTATVTATAATAGMASLSSPTGVIAFYDTFNGVMSKLGSATLTALGAGTSQATFNTAGLATGTHSVYAVYAGDTVYIGSTSGTITLGSADFSVNFVPASMTLSQGQSGSATLLVNFQGGFVGTVAFGCRPPANVEITCSFSPAAITSAGSTTLTVATVAPSARSDGQHAGLLARFASGVAMAMLFVRPRSKRFRMRLALLLMLLAVAISGVTGCSGTNGAGTNGGTTTAPPTNPGSSLGTQILTITTAGSDGANTVRHDYSYQVTVQ